MKPIKNTEKYLRLIMLPLFAFMLVLSTVLPSVALAATEEDIETEQETEETETEEEEAPIVVTLDPVTITQDDINTKSSNIKLTLGDGRSWVTGINTQATLLIENMTANFEEAAWNTYKKGIRIALDPTNEQVLIVTLPRATYSITKNQTIRMDIPAELIENGQGSLKPVTFDIEFSGTSILTVVSDPVTEAGIQTSGATITLKLTDNEWSIDTDAKKAALINAFVTKNQPEQWKKVKDMLSVSNVTKDTVTLTSPAVADYELSTNQTISLNVPYQLLENGTALNEVELIVESSPKVLISGTVTPDVSQGAIINGGGTIVVTLVNAVWDANIATNTALREKLLEGFKFDVAYTEFINAEANVVRTNDQVVTITLPPIAGLKIATDTPIAFDEKSITATQNFNALIPNAFTIKPTSNQTATISGSIVGANEFDISQGDKEITITLKNDRWTTDLKKLDQFKDGFVAEGDTPVNLIAKKVDRTSDTVLTITLQEVPNFTISDDITLKFDIPAELLSNSGKSITTTAFKIVAVKAELPSKKDLVLDKSDIQKGGKIISITLKNATFKEDLVIDEALIDSVFANSSPSWTIIMTALKNNLNNISISKNRITIKLPPVPDYDSITAATLELKVPAGLIDHDKAKEVIVDGEITAGAVATATLDQKTFSHDQIKAGNEVFKIALTGTEWDPTIITNRSKKTALLRGFKVTDQTKEWSLLSKEISSNAQFELSEDHKVVTITLPAVPGYSIIRDQVVDINIPKSVLVNYKEDITVTDQLTITVPTSIAGDKSLSELTAEELADAMANNKRVIVPSKTVEKIFVNTVEYPSPDKGKTSITTIEVTTVAGVKEVQVTVANGTPQTVKHSGDSQSKSTFVYTDLEKNSELKVSVFGDNSESLQNDIYKKIGKGSKTYNEIPKKNLAGSYLLYDILTHKSLLKDILKNYSIDELKVTS